MPNLSQFKNMGIMEILGAIFGILALLGVIGGAASGSSSDTVPSESTPTATATTTAPTSTTAPTTAPPAPESTSAPAPVTTTSTEMSTAKPTTPQPSTTAPTTSVQPSTETPEVPDLSDMPNYPLSDTDADFLETMIDLNMVGFVLRGGAMPSMSVENAAVRETQNVRNLDFPIVDRAGIHYSNVAYEKDGYSFEVIRVSNAMAEATDGLEFLEDTPADDYSGLDYGIHVTHDGEFFYITVAMALSSLYF